MATDTWFVRLDTGETRPMTWEELRQLATEGVLKADTLVSFDKVTWQDAARVDGLFPPRPAAWPIPPLQPASPPPIPAADSSAPSRPGSDNFFLSTFYAVQDFVCKFCNLKPLTGFKVSYLFSDVLKRRSRAEVDSYFNCGCARTTPGIVAVSSEWPRPWFFARMLLFGLLTTLGFWFGMAAFENPNMVPGLIVVAAFFVPLSCVAFFYELNILRNISFYQVTKMIVCGGIVSLLVSLLLYHVTGLEQTFLGVTSAGLIEETAKVLAAVLLLLWVQQYKWILNGILVGAAVGAGFAGFETAGYGFVALLNDMTTPGESQFESTLILRAVCAPFCHVVWTASVVGALWWVKGEQPFRASMLLKKDFLRVLAFVVMLHMVWNCGVLWRFVGSFKGPVLIKVGGFFWLLSFVGSWYLVLLLVQEGLRQVEAARIAAIQSVPDLDEGMQGEGGVENHSPLASDQSMALR